MLHLCRIALLPCLMAGVFTLAAEAQQTAPQAGLRENPSRVHALENARIYVRPDQVIEHGTVVVRDGLVVEVGASIDIPPDASRWDYTGMTIYPGMIEMFTQAGLPKGTRMTPRGPHTGIPPFVPNARPPKRTVSVKRRSPGCGNPDSRRPWRWPTRVCSREAAR